MRTRAEAEAAFAAGERPKILAFWGHTAKRDDVVDNACLSQWFPAPFEKDGLRFATAEHFMMHGKAVLFGDVDAAAKVLADPRPAVAKKIGRTVRNFDPQSWGASCFSIVVEGNVLKFGQHPALRDFLLATGDKLIVEASPMDKIWGVGLRASDPRVADPKTWNGQNLLGFALMEARARLR